MTPARPAADSVFELVYVSAVDEDCSRDELRSIARHAKRANQAAGVTGLLLECRGEFIQVLEGSEAAVRALYEKIRQDPRHSRVTLAATTRKPRRAFPDWSMGCFFLDPASAPKGGFLAAGAPAQEANAETTRRLIAFFAERYPDLRLLGAGEGFAEAPAPQPAG